MLKLARFRRTLKTLLGLALLPGFVFAQSISGDLVVTVIDSSEASVSGARLALTEL